MRREGERVMREREEEETQGEARGGRENISEK